MMNGNRRPLLLGTALGIGLFLSACAADETGGNPADNTAALKDSAWLAEDIDGKGVMDILQTTLAFSEGDRVAGSGGCNNYFGLAVVKGDSFTMGPVGATQKLCPEAIMDQEQRFFAALQKVQRFETRDGLLFLFGESDAPILRFSRISDG